MMTQKIIVILPINKSGWNTLQCTAKLEDMVITPENSLDTVHFRRAARLSTCQCTVYDEHGKPLYRCFLQVEGPNSFKPYEIIRFAEVKITVRGQEYSTTQYFLLAENGVLPAGTQIQITTGPFLISKVFRTLGEISHQVTEVEVEEVPGIVQPYDLLDVPNSETDDSDNTKT